VDGAEAGDPGDRQHAERAGIAVFIGMQRRIEKIPKFLFTRQRASTLR
jgi:hypothetical protein